MGAKSNITIEKQKVLSLQIKAYLELSGVNCQELSRDLGYSEGYIYKILNGKNVPSNAAYNLIQFKFKEFGEDKINEKVNEIVEREKAEKAKKEEELLKRVNNQGIQMIPKIDTSPLYYLADEFKKQLEAMSATLHDAYAVMLTNNTKVCDFETVFKKYMNDSIAFNKIDRNAIERIAEQFDISVYDLIIFAVKDFLNHQGKKKSQYGENYLIPSYLYNDWSYFENDR